ncbi:hypothetical protein CDD83_5819 [Cordyceps sp. RAO-2017]|nr:hypothetical protein CDD83_5819 [Cordyceps sp. RAO-2017]
MKRSRRDSTPLDGTTPPRDTSSSRLNPFNFNMRFSFQISLDQGARGLQTTRQRAELKDAFALELAAFTGLPIAEECTHVDSEDINLSKENCDRCMRAAENNTKIGDEHIIISRWPAQLPRGLHPLLHYYIVNMVPRELSTAGTPLVEIRTPVYNGMVELSTEGPTKLDFLMTFGMGRALSGNAVADTNSRMAVAFSYRGGMTLLWAKRAATLAMLLETTVCRWLSPADRLDLNDEAQIQTLSKFAKRTFPDDRVDLRLSYECDDLRQNFPWDRLNITPGSWNHFEPDEFRATLRLIWNTSSLDELAEGLRKAPELRNPHQPLGFSISLRKDTPVYDERSAANYSYEWSRTSTLNFQYAPMDLNVDYIKRWGLFCWMLCQLALLNSAEFAAGLGELINRLKEFDNDDTVGNATRRIFFLLGLENHVSLINMLD